MKPVYTKIWEYTPPKPKRFEAEKETYQYFKRVIGFKGGFKLYSPVLRGLPDFVVTELQHEKLNAGFYEVKFKNNWLRPTQEKILFELSKIAPVYVVNIQVDGSLAVKQLIRF